MVYFSFRQQKHMLDALDPLLTYPKRMDLIQRLKNKRPEQVLGAEMELALCHGFSQNWDSEIEPLWYPGNRNPDIYVEDFFVKPAFIEITAISDESISDKKVMRAAAQKITQYVNKLRKGRGKFLYFTFQERSGYRLSGPGPHHPVFPKKEYYRERLVSKDFELCDQFKHTLRWWITNPNWPEPKAVRIQLDYVDVVIRVKDFVYPSTHNFHSTMPALCYSLEENPIFVALKSKEKQLKATPSGNLKVVFLCDGGCKPLSELSRHDSTNRVKSGAEIIRHYLRQGSQLDHVIVVAPKFDTAFASRSQYKKFWAFTQFNGFEHGDLNYGDKLKKLFSHFPKPLYESSNAKGLILQGSFKPNNRYQHLGTSYMSKGIDIPEFQIKTSAKAVYELISGRIDFERFKKITGIDEKVMKSEYRIQNIEFQGKGPSNDDDYVTVTLSTDVAATGLIE
ncbi:hypothetical protein N9M10_01135 [Hellea sp.]|nr:hypothetical protein [Hellea sp.]